MVRRRVSPRDSSSASAVANAPAQQDTGDVLSDVDAERDEETGDLLVDEDKIRSIGAVDAVSVIENQRTRSAVDKKRKGEKVRFNSGDVLTQYDAAVKVWPPNTLDITVRRLTGTPVQHAIMSRPRSGIELYEAIMAKHGQYEEAEYEVKVVDSNLKEFRVNGRITMPDTRSATHQGQPMTQQYYPPGYPPPGYPPPQAVPQQGYPPGYPPGYAPAQPAQQAQPAPQQAQAPQPQQAPQQSYQQPVVVQAPAGPDMATMMDSFKQMFGLFQSMQPPPAPPQQTQYAPQPPPAFVMPAPPPMPPPGADMPTMITWMQQMFDLFRTMQPPAAVAAPVPTSHVAQPQPQQSPATMGPTRQPPQGMMWVWEPNFGFVLMPAAAPPPGVAGPGDPRPPYRGPRPGAYYPQGEPAPGRVPYYPQGEPQQGGRPPYYPQHGDPAHSSAHSPQQQQRQLTPAEQFREAIGVVRSAVSAVEEMNSILPQGFGGGSQDASPPPLEEDDDSPVRVIDTGPAKIVVNKSDGSTRLWETGMANMDKIFKWVGEQHQVIQKAQNDRRQQQPQQHQLPEGYVEVREGYTPPPGYVAVPVEHHPQQQQYAPPQQQQQRPLPPPPEHVPPPISSPPRQAWGAPPIPSGQEEQ